MEYALLRILQPQEPCRDVGVKETVIMVEQRKLDLITTQHSLKARSASGWLLVSPRQSKRKDTILSDVEYRGCFLM